MTPTDLDALAALLAAATPGPWYAEIEGPDSILRTRIGTEGHRRGVGDYAFLTFDEDVMSPDQSPAAADAALIVAAVNALPSLIEAARREAGLRRLVENLVAAYEADYPKGGLASALSNVALDARIFLLHDNAGTGER